MRSLMLGVVWATVFWLLVKAASAFPWRSTQVLSGEGLHEPRIPTWKEPRHIRIFIVDNIPSAYTSSPYSQTGPSVGHEAPAPNSNGSSSSNNTDSTFRQARSRDFMFHQWMVEQLRASPLRVYEEEEADFFVVPTFLPADDTHLQASPHPAAASQCHWKAAEHLLGTQWS